MNNDRVENIIQSFGAMVEMWCIVYQNFKAQKFSDEDALEHTKAFMSIMLTNVMHTNDGEEKKQ